MLRVATLQCPVIIHLSQGFDQNAFIPKQASQAIKLERYLCNILGKGNFQKATILSLTHGLFNDIITDKDLIIQTLN